MNITYPDKLTFEEYAESTAAIEGEPLSTDDIVKILFGAICLSFLVSNFSKKIAVILFCIIAGFCALSIFLKRRKKSIVERALASEAGGEVELKEDGMFIAREHQTSFVDWSAFSEHYKGKEIFMLYNNPQSYVVVPYRVFPTEDALNQFIDHVTRIVKQEFTPKK